MSTLFTDITLPGGKPAKITTRVITRTKPSQVTEYGFMLRHGAMVEHKWFLNRPSAEQAHARYLPPAPTPTTTEDTMPKTTCPVDDDLLDKVVQELMAQHGAGTAAVTWDANRVTVTLDQGGTHSFDEDGAYAILGAA